MKRYFGRLPITNIYTCLAKTFTNIKRFSILEMESFYNIHSCQFSHFYKVIGFWIQI